MPAPRPDEAAWSTLAEVEAPAGEDRPDDSSLKAEGLLDRAIRKARSKDGAALFCDGSLEGLLSAVFVAYAAHMEPGDIVQAGRIIEPRLGQSVIEIPTDVEAAVRVRNGIRRTCGAAGFEAVRIASLADDTDTGTTIYRFIRRAMDLPTEKPASGCRTCPRKTHCVSPCPRMGDRTSLGAWADEDIGPLLKLERAVLNENHRLQQFIRFQHLDNGTWFARCNPNASVVPLLMSWFSPRFNTQDFAIYDEVHRIAGISREGRWGLVRTDGDLSLPTGCSEEEDLMQKAWKRFYDALSIDSRYHPELRRQFMPMRLWRNITEMQETIDRPSVARH